MKTTTLLFSLLSLLMAFNACKEPNEPLSHYLAPRIKKTAIYLDGKLSFETTYQYDATGRLIKSSVSDKNYIQYTYLEGKVIVKAYVTGEEDIPADTLLLNDQGLQISTSPASTIEYDAEGYLIKRTLLINNVPNSHVFQVEDGNTVQWIYRTGNQYENTVNNQTYAFLPNTVNTIGNENHGIAFYGTQDNNLLGSTSYIYYHSTGKEEATITYKYELDSKNRVIKKSSVEDSGHFSTLYTYYD